MYSTLLLEDFITSLKRRMILTAPISTFVTGFFIGMDTAIKSNKSKKSMAKKATSIILFLLTISMERLQQIFYQTLAPIIDKFTLPIDKVVKSIKDKSFLAPNSRFYDIIALALSFLFLVLGFTLANLVLLKLKIIALSQSYQKYKHFLWAILKAYGIALAVDIAVDLLSSPINYGKIFKFDVETLKKSPNRAKQAAAKAYELVASKYPQITKVPTYYISNFMASAGFFCIKYPNKNYVGIPKEFIAALTDNELVAIYLHEFGHLLNVPSASIGAYYTTVVLTYKIQNLAHSTSTIKEIVEFTSLILDHFMASVASFNQEIYADTFAVSMGYGRYLSSALQKLEKHFRTDEDVAAFVHRIVTHPQTNKRVENIEKAEQYFKQQTNELFEKSTEIIKEELNKESVNV
jgi:Zn-dependent protease with chaperone function